jgi:hypothetical protein
MGLVLAWHCLGCMGSWFKAQLLHGILSWLFWPLALYVVYLALVYVGSSLALLCDRLLGTVHATVGMLADSLLGTVHATVGTLMNVVQSSIEQKVSQLASGAAIVGAQREFTQFLGRVNIINKMVEDESDGSLYAEQQK